ncbi:hypothetical protein HV560_00860 [Mannheimia pernigra]|uniref:Bacterial Ig domain-containing protein n=1 Tax=Mannheimia pernigra TaxID=111844 RepID=A0ABD7A623_9PAST|nr:Ig-like domain-containing protein [Mannheimia pernigra]QLB41499.1 hypothetical protein HV560_00860 [Mannheimia pernigra]
MNINIGQSAKVVLPVKSVAIKRTVRVGNNLEVYLSNGSVITLENYFPNKPTLLTNEGNNKVAEFTISDDGIIVGIKELSADEAASMLSNAYSSLSTQPNDVLLLSANDASANTANTAVSGKSYTMEVIGASAGLLAGMFILSDKGSKSTPAKANKTDDSKTTTERVDSDNNGTLDTEVITNRDASGQITKEIRKTDANNSGKIEKIVTTQKNNDGSKTVTVEESTKDNGVFDKSVETTTDKNGNKKTVESRDTNNDGKKDNIITTETNTDGSKITTEKKTDGSTITTKDDGKGNTSIETKNLDGTSSKQETKSDGTKIHTEKNSEGIITSTTTKPSGETYTTTTKPDGKGGSTSVTVNKDKSGNTTSTENAIDKNNDGNSEETIKTETKPDGTKVITKTEDLNSDGKTDSTTRTETKPSGETQSVTENADGTTVTTTVSKPNPDGSTNSTIITKNKNGDVVATTNKVTQDDGSSVANTTRPDGSTSITKDNGKGTVTIENRDPSGKLTDSTTTVTKANGSSVSTTEKADGTSVTTTTKPNKDGSTSATAVEKDANNNIIATTETKTKPNGDSTSETKYSNGTSTTVTKTDTNGDGTQDTTVITEKDKNGKVISTETSVDLSPTDGNPETVTKVEPQADGSTKTTVTKDNNSDGKVDSVAESETQANGTKIEKVKHKDENGTVTGTSETTTTPDGKGGLISHTVHKDSNGNATGKTESTTKPDGKGGTTTTSIQKGKDGDVISKTETQKNADGSSTSETKNTDGTSSTTQDNGKGVVTTTEKGKDNKVTSTETVIDANKDGNPESVVKTETKTDGTKVTTEKADKDSNGQADSETMTTTRPDDTSTVEKKEDTNGDGTLDTKTTIEKTKDGKTTSTKTVVDKDADGNPESTKVEEKKPDNTTIITEEVDKNSDGIVDSTITTTKRPGGSSTESVKNQDGSTSTTEDNGQGIVIKTEKDKEGNVTKSTEVTRDNGSKTTTIDRPDNTSSTIEDDGKGTITTTESNNGKKTSSETKVDKDQDGIVESTTKVVTKSDGTEVTTETKDENEDGKAESEITTTKHPEGSAVVETTVEKKDTDGNGILDTTITTEKNKNGNTVSTKEVDKDQNGKPEAITTTEETKNQDGTTTIVTKEDNNADGNVDVTTTTTKHTNGSSTSETQNAVDGTTSITKADGKGNEETTTSKKDGSKSVETKRPDGSSTTISNNADGSADKTENNGEGTTATVNKNGASVSGTTKPGATVTVTDKQGNELGNAVANEKGEYNIPLNPPKTNGETINVNVKDSAGTTTTAPITVFDVTPPSTPTAENTTSSADKANGKVTISGTTEPGADVVIKDAKGKEVGKGKANEEGKYNVELTETDNAKNGETLTVEVTDKGNNTVTGTITAPDISEPSTPTAENTTSSADKANGKVTISGTTEPGADVVIKDAKGKEVGKGKANEEGKYNVELTETDNAKNGETLTVEVTDKGNNTVTGTITAPDISEPSTPTAENTTSSADKTNGKVTISGTTEPGADVVIKDAKGKEVGKGKANEEGKYNVELTETDNAKNGETLTVEVTDKGNNTVTGTITAPDISEPSTPTAENTTSSADKTNGKVTISGTTEPGADVVIKDAKGKEIGKGKANNEGKYNVELTETDNAKNGETLTVEVTDKGNNTVTGTITAPDITKPSIPTVDNTVVKNNENGSVTVKGKTEPGATVVIKDKNDKEIGGATANQEGDYDITLNDANNAKNGETLTIEVTDKAGQTTKGTIKAIDITPPPTPDAQNTKSSADKANDTVTISGTTEPGATVVIKDATDKKIGEGEANEEGAYSIKLTETDKAKNGETLTVEVTDKAGQTTKGTIVAPDVMPPKALTEVKINKEGNEITGKGEAGSIIEVRAPGSNDVIAKATVQENGSFSVKVPATAPENVVVIAKDAKGNETEANPIRLPDLSDPLTAVVQNDKKVSTYSDSNHDGKVDTAEVATYQTKPTLNERTKEVNSDAKVVQIDHYLEASDIANGEGNMSVPNGGKDLDVKGADQHTYFIYDTQGNLKKRLYDLDAKSNTGSSQDGKNGIDKYETIEAFVTKKLTVKSKTGVEQTKDVVLETQIAYNNDATGKDDARAYFEYNDKGQKTFAFYDDNADGKIDRAEKYTYSDKDRDNPNPIKIEYDNDANGVTEKVPGNKNAWKLDESHFDKVEHFEYKAATTKVENGTITEYLTTAKYVNTDNKTETGSKQTINGQEVQGLDIIEKYDYNDYNRQTKIEYDNNGDGTADKIHYQKYITNVFFFTFLQIYI